MQNHPDKKVLIICYPFPPYPGIGGRRWAKFAKYFAKQNVECHVINATNHFKVDSAWANDVKATNIFIHSLPFRFKYWMTHTSNSIPYRIVAKLLRTGISFTKYSPHFYTSLAKKELLQKSIELIKQHDIKTVIVSGDPYTFYYTTLLKQHCDVRVMLDFRDLWNDHTNFRQHHKLTAKQRGYFEFCENEAINAADVVVGVDTLLTDKLKLRCKNSTTIFKEIPNGYDPDDFAKVVPPKRQTGKIIAFLAGSTSPADRHNFELFLKAHTSLQKSHPDLWNSFDIRIQGNYPPEFEVAVAALNNPNITIKKGLMSKEEYFNKLAEATYGIMLLPEDYKDSFFITKTFDYFYMQKPIIVISPEGKVSKFIEDNHIGLVFNTGKEMNAPEFFTKLKEESATIHYSKEVLDFIDRNYNIKNLANTYISQII